MPTQVSVIGTKTFQPSVEQVRRIQEFYKWLPMSKTPDTVILIPPKDFPATARAFNAQTDTALTHAGRSYLNAALLDSKETTGKNNLEWALAHEAAHMNSPEVPRIQEQQDKIYDDQADDIIRKWNSRPVRAYRTSQDIAAKLPGQFEPTLTPPSSHLTSPSVRNTFGIFTKM